MSDDLDERPVDRSSAVFTADDDTSRALAEVDWSATPLGSPDDWPRSLRISVQILLSSRFPMWMSWGPELTFLCNDAFRRDTLGHKYPWALGRPAHEVWPEIWDEIGPRIDRVLATGEGTWDETMLLFLERSGYTEETYHTCSYSPLRDEDGSVAGVFSVAREETDRFIAERRMATLRELGAHPRVTDTDDDTLALAREQLEHNLSDLPFTLVYLFDSTGGATLSTVTGIVAGHRLAPEKISATSTAPWPVSAVRDGASKLVDISGFEDVPTGAWPDPPWQALVLPLQQTGHEPYGFIVTGLNRYRGLDAHYRTFLETVAQHISAGIMSSRFHQAQQNRAEELAELDRAKTDFFSNISHEFRTPLTLILGPIDELLSRGPGLDDSVRSELAIAHRSGLRLSRLVSTLLDFSRIEAGGMEPDLVPADVGVVTAELASVFRAVAQRAGLTFDVNSPAIGGEVLLDHDMWEKVIFNLLSNAVKFTFEGGITVTTKLEGEEAVVSVRDTGIGIAADEMPRLFERFYRVHSVRARSIEGTGIGLALARELVELQSGNIGAESREGEGSTFTVRLPWRTGTGPDQVDAPRRLSIATSSYAQFRIDEAGRWPPMLPDASTAARPEDPAPAGVKTAALAVPPASSWRNARVLLVDDNADMREYLSRIMSGDGFDPVSAGDGQEALDAIRADPPDLVISDVMMPRLDGLALVRELRSDPRTATLPVILLSARAGEDASIDGLHAGADDYLVKPFGAAELLARARNSVKLARLRNYHTRWRTALVDSLQEGFFLCDDGGAVIEINTAFTDILGFGAEGIPYRSPFPWSPDEAGAVRDGAADADSFSSMIDHGHGSFTLPLKHRDGHQIWVTASFSPADDPTTDRHVTVGTLRDVTAEHYTIQRDAARVSLIARLAPATDVDEALIAALDELQQIWGATRVLGAVFRPGDEPQVLATDGTRDWRQLSKSLRRRFIGPRRHPELTPVLDGSGCGVRLEHPAGQLVLWIEMGEHRRFSAEDQLLLSLLAGHLAQALARTHQIDQQRKTAIALQRAILGPAEMPSGFAVRYEPATPPLEVGGDWYDTIALPDGRIGIVVGDCVGRGLRAAAVMGQLRSACRALLLRDPSPAKTLMALDRFADGVPGAVCTTVFCGVLDPRSGRLVYSNAGHPPCIIGGPTVPVRLLEDARSIPLAVRSGERRPEAECFLPQRGTMALYTDGLVERRKQSLTVGIARACEVVDEGANGTVEQLADALMFALEPPGGYDDDVAILLYRYPGPMELTFAADAAELAPMRSALRDWLRRADVGRDAAQSVLVAVGEACSNSIEHGYRADPSGTVEVRAEASGNSLRLTVTDHGKWKVPEVARTNRGRGITLMQGLTDEVTIHPSTTGTTVEMLVRIA